MKDLEVNKRKKSSMITIVMIDIKGVAVKINIAKKKRRRNKDLMIEDLVLTKGSIVDTMDDYDSLNILLV